MNNKNKEIKLINLSIIAITIFIITLLISLLLNYNEKLKLENNCFLQKSQANADDFLKILKLVFKIIQNKNIYN